MRQVRDRIDAALHLVDELIDVHVEFGLKIDIAHAFARHAGEALEAVNVSDNLFKPHDNLILDILRGGTRPGDGNARAVPVAGRKGFLLQAEETEDPADKGDDHEKVGSNTVTGPPGY